MLKLLCISIHIPNFSLDFPKFQFFNGQNGQEGGTASLCQILSKSFQLWPRYGDFRFFKMASAVILDFRNWKFLTVEEVKKVEMHQHASNVIEIARTAAEICEFQYCQNLPSRFGIERHPYTKSRIDQILYVRRYV